MNGWGEKGKKYLNISFCEINKCVQSGVMVNLRGMKKEGDRKRS